MIDLPFQMVFDLNFEFDLPKQELLNVINELLFEINPRPYVNIYFNKIDEKLYDFTVNISKYSDTNIIALNPDLNKQLINLMKQRVINIWNNNDLNNTRENLKHLIQFPICKHCEKFYKENFFIVEDCILEYNNRKYIFNDVMNPVKSAPMLGIISLNELCYPIPIYSDKIVNEIYSKYNLVLLIK